MGHFAECDGSRSAARPWPAGQRVPALSTDSQERRARESGRWDAEARADTRRRQGARPRIGARNRPRGRPQFVSLRPRGDAQRSPDEGAFERRESRSTTVRRKSFFADLRSSVVVVPFRVGPWRVDPCKNVIERNGHRVRIEPKAMRVLVHLAERAGEDVGRDEILRAVWDSSPVRTDVLTNAIWELRKAFDDDAHEPDVSTKVSKGVSPRCSRDVIPDLVAARASSTLSRCVFSICGDTFRDYGTLFEYTFKGYAPCAPSRKITIPRLQARCSPETYPR